MIAPEVLSARDKIAPGIDAALAQYANDNMQIKCWETVLRCVREHPLLNWVAKVISKRMGVRKSNRGGIGIMTAKALSLGAANCANGYSYTMACKDAFASSMPTEAGELHKFNEELNRRQSLPPLEVPIGASLGSGHGNGFLRLRDARAPCSIASIAPSGFLDPVELGKLHPGLAEALAYGLAFEFIHHCVFDKWPVIAEIMQKALNSKNLQVQTEAEGLLTMASVAAATLNDNKAVDWNSVANDACQAKPHWQPWARSMGTFCKVTPLELIHEFVMNVTSLVPPPTTNSLQSVFVGGAFF